MGLLKRLFGSGGGEDDRAGSTHRERGDVERAAHRLAQLYDEAVWRAKAATTAAVRAQQLGEARKRLDEIKTLVRGNRMLKMKTMAECEAELAALETGDAGAGPAIVEAEGKQRLSRPRSR